MSEIRKLCKKTPIILVATGIDSIDEKDNVSKEEGLMIMDKCGVDAYVECETNNKDQVAELFEDALLSVKSRKRRRSSLLHSLIHRWYTKRFASGIYKLDGSLFIYTEVAYYPASVNHKGGLHNKYAPAAYNAYI